MNYIRTLVSGKKKRYVDTKYNLDLSYITSRLIAMAYPASGIKTMYRNSIDEVSQFLKERHGFNYIVINLSGRKYDYSKFDHKVLEYEWVDHHAPPLKTLFIICQTIHEFLKDDARNVVAINCRAGKGRTGTIICCYMLFSGRFTSPEECFDYYSKKRFKAGEGVTQPSQKKYVKYFYTLLKEKIFFPYVICIKEITLYKMPLKKGGGIKPYFEIYMGNSDKICYSNKTGYLAQKKIILSDSDFLTISDPAFSLLLGGDLTIKIYHHGMLSSKKLGRISFNTGFIEPEQDTLRFRLWEIDPDNLVTNKSIPRDFEILVKFEKVCQCNNREPVNVCKNCEEYLQNEIQSWSTIYDIIKNYSPMSKDDEESVINAKTLLFGDPEGDDVEKVLTSEPDVEEEIGNSFKESSEEESEGNDSVKKSKESSANVKEEELNTSFDNDCFIY